MRRKSKSVAAGVMSAAGPGSVLLASPKAKQLASWILVRKDLQFVEAAAAHLMRMSTDPHLQPGDLESSDLRTIRKSLWFALVATYGKLFTTAEGRWARLDDSNVSRLHETLQATHGRLMATRHTYVAHGGVSREETCAVQLDLNVSTPERRWVQISTVCLYAGPPIPEGLEPILALVRDLLKPVGTRIDELYRLVAEEVNAKPIDFWYDQMTRNTANAGVRESGSVAIGHDVDPPSGQVSTDVRCDVVPRPTGEVGT